MFWILQNGLERNSCHTIHVANVILTAEFSEIAPESVY